MSFNVQIPGTIQFSELELNENEVPSQKSCYSFVEKVSGITNPVCLQHDVMYANAFAAIMEQNNSSENELQLALGCVGHKTDREFPLESKTPTPLPLIMYPTATNGNLLDEVDICAMPVLNWELYIQDIKPKLLTHISKKCKSSELGNGKDTQPEPEENIPECLVVGSEEQLQNPCIENTNSSSDIPTSEDVLCTSKMKLPKKGQKIVTTRRVRKVVSAGQVRSESEMQVNPRNEDSSIKTSSTRRREEEATTVSPGADCIPAVSKQRGSLAFVSWKKLKNQPKLKIEGTWNHLYAGSNGSCCFMKSTSNLCLYVGKGTKLRLVELNEANPSSIFSYNVLSVWDEDQVPSFINIKGSDDSDPFDEIIFQVIPNESNKIVGVRRGRTIHIYDTENHLPVLLESVPNMLYGTNEYCNNLQRQRKAHNPFLRGFDFSPTPGPEIISIDENQVIRVCNIYKKSTSDIFVLPSSGSFSYVPKDYPNFKLNDAIGISFANHDKLFYAWGDSIVYMGDRRSRKFSRAHIVPLFDLRNHAYSHALSSQNYFHESATKLNEYMSCLKKSKRDSYYYVGTTSKIYLMDLRVPSHPVIAVSHGLQSSLTYMDICSGEGESFETIVGGSQRMSETVCMSLDFTHLECLQRPGCKARHPLLYCYPRHLLNPRIFFDAAVNEGYDFPYPIDHEQVKGHMYAWTTGLAMLPISGGKTTLPGGMIIASNNNFGDVFWQEWEQKPLSSHKSLKFSDYKLGQFLSKWHKAMHTKLHTCNTEPSKNPYNSVDCTLLVEPLAKEIESLPRVRDSPFDCFQQNQVQMHENQRTMLSINDLCQKLSKYNNSKAQTILNVWRGAEYAEHETEQVEIKLEPAEWPQSFSPTTSTIDINSTSDENEIETQEVDHRISQTEDDVQNTQDGAQDDIDYILETSQMAQWPENYCDMFENSQNFLYGDGIQENFRPDDDVQDLYSPIPSSSSSRPKKVQKGRRTGF